jgi:small subunit ribosomal protein S2
MAVKVEYKELLDAGVHFGHLTRKWDPRMAPYIFMERNGIHIIDLNKTLACLDDALEAIRDMVRQNRRIMFVATKKQAKELVAEEARRLKMPFVTERWLGGMLTNFATVRKSLKKMQNIEKMLGDPKTAANLAKKEKLMMSRERDKLERVLGGIVDMKGLPAALFVVDIKKEHIAVAEAQKLGIPVIGMVDTNSNPYECDFPIPANDDAFKSIQLITKLIGQAIEEAYQERKRDKDDEQMVAEEEFAAAAAQVATSTESEMTSETLPSESGSEPIETVSALAEPATIASEAETTDLPTGEEIA